MISKISIKEILLLAHTIRDLSPEEKGMFFYLLTGLSFLYQEKVKAKANESSDESKQPEDNKTSNENEPDTQKVFHSDPLTIEETKNELQWETDWKDVTKFDLGNISLFSDSLDFEPLFHPLKAREIIRYAISIYKNDGEIDSVQLVNRIARNQIHHEFPRLKKKHLPDQVHVLIDRSQSMAVFEKDVDWFILELQKLISPNNIQIWTVQKNLLHAQNRYTDEILSIQKSKIPMIVLTDLNSGDKKRIQEWKRVMEKAKNLPITYFVPFPRKRISNELLTQKPRIVFWDRKTTIRTLLKSIGA